MLIPLLLALCADQTLLTTNAPVKLQSLPPTPPAPVAAPVAAPAIQRHPVYILPKVWAVQTSPGVIYLRIPDHNFQDLVELFPTNVAYLTNVVVYREVTK